MSPATHHAPPSSSGDAGLAVRKPDPEFEKRRQAGQEINKVRRNRINDYSCQDFSVFKDRLPVLAGIA